MLVMICLLYKENIMSKMNKINFVSIPFLINALTILSSLSTIDGAGKDIESVGEAIQN